MKNLLFTCILLTILSGCDKDDSIDDTPPGNDEPAACFSMDKTTCNLGDCTVNFNASCSKNAVNYEWDFGDGSPVVQGADLAQVSHTYTNSGVKTVKLIVSSDLGFSGEQSKDEVRDTILVNILEPIACLTADKTECILGDCIINFDASCSDNAVYFIWDFGDGSPALEGNDLTQVSHNYTSGGVKTIRLVVKNGLSIPGEQLEDTMAITVLVKTYFFEKTYGGEVGHDVQQTQDGGYVVIGSTGSEGAGNYDVFLIKTDEFGEVVWTKTYGGVNNDQGYGVRQTQDGGYIVVGSTYSEGAGNYDVYLIKTDESGNIAWSNTYGGAATDDGYSVRQTMDGGYIITGRTVSQGAGFSDVYLIKTDESGNPVWEKTFGGVEFDVGNDVEQAQDGGYIVVGQTTLSPGTVKIYLVKTDQYGEQIWSKTFGEHYGGGNSVGLTDDGGYIIAGNSYPALDNNSEFHLIKTDPNGDLVWENTFGFDGIGPSVETGNSVQQTDDGGYILAGTASVPIGNNGVPKVFLSKIDQSGNQLWEKTFSGGRGRSVDQTEDGGYIMVGDAGNTIYLIRTDQNGNIE